MSDEEFRQKLNEHKNGEIASLLSEINYAPRKRTVSMKYLSFGEWNKLGYCVIKGSKSCKKDNNDIALFNEEQVKKDDYRSRYEDIDDYDLTEFY